MREREAGGVLCLCRSVVPGFSLDSGLRIDIIVQCSLDTRPEMNWVVSTNSGWLNASHENPSEGMVSRLVQCAC